MDEQVVVKIPAEKKQELQRLATKTGVNLSSLIRMILFERLEKEAA